MKLPREEMDGGYFALYPSFFDFDIMGVVMRKYVTRDAGVNLNTDIGF